jgi:hypothetical protein
MKLKLHDITHNISQNLIFVSVIFICRSPGNVLDRLGIKSCYGQDICRSSKAFRLVLSSINI